MAETATTADSVAKLTDKALSVMDGMEEIFRTYGPEVANSALDVIQIHGAFNLTLGVFFIVVALVLTPIAFYFWKKCDKLSKSDEDAAFGAGFYGFVSSLALVVFLVLGCIKVLTLAYWMAAFSPKAALMYRLIEGQGLI